VVIVFTAKRRVVEQKRGLDAEIARQIAEQVAGQHADWDLRDREQTKKIADLEEALKEAHRIARRGPSRWRGEVLETAVEDELRRMFSFDGIVPVPNGQHCADIDYKVRDRRLRDCGQIVIEAKNARHWYPAWIDRAKENRRAKVRVRR